MLLKFVKGNDIKDFLHAHTSEKFAENAEEMRSFILKQDAVRRFLQNRNEDDAWLRTVACLVGSRSIVIGAQKLKFDFLKAGNNKNSYNCFVSHRSGETVDSFIADLTVAVNEGHLKTGSGCRGERIEKFNQLMRIESELGKASRFAGVNAF